MASLAMIGASTAMCGIFPPARRGGAPGAEVATKITTNLTVTDSLLLKEQLIEEMKRLLTGGNINYFAFLCLLSRGVCYIAHE